MVNIKYLNLYRNSSEISLIWQNHTVFRDMVLMSAAAAAGVLKKKKLATEPEEKIRLQ